MVGSLLEYNAKVSIFCFMFCCVVFFVWCVVFDVICLGDVKGALLDLGIQCKLC